MFTFNLIPVFMMHLLFIMVLSASIFLLNNMWHIVGQTKCAIALLIIAMLVGFFPNGWYFFTVDNVDQIKQGILIITPTFEQYLYAGLVGSLLGYISALGFY